jgi:SPP1 gp7 family putative phage head morphogenesis protein
MSKSQELFDLNIEHLLLTRRYGAATALLLEKAGNRHRSFLSKILKRDLKDRKEIEREVTRHVRELYALSSNSITDFVGSELDFQTNSLRKVSGGWYDVATVNRGEIEKAITKSPLKLFSETKQYGDLEKSFNSIGSSSMTRINLSIRKGIAEGRAEDLIIQDVLKTTKLTENQAKSLVATHLTQAETTIKEKVLEANSDLVSGLVFTAILDSRTSEICSRYDGLFQTKENLKVRPPLHWRCRSTLVPVLKGKKELLASNSPRINQELLASQPDGNLPGSLPLKETFSDWLRRQPMATKLDKLGSEEKVALFEKGSLPLSDFISGKGNPIGIAALRLKDNLLTYFNPIRILDKDPQSAFLDINRPFQLLRSKQAQKDLVDLIVADSMTAGQAISLTDFRGTTLAGKRGVRSQANNEFNPRNQTFDPFTGEVRSTLYYDPDFTLYRERLDYMKQSKLLDRKQKEFIEQFVDSLEDRISVNQQSVVVENLRVLFERYQKNPVPWENFVATLRAEMNFSTVNVSRLLDRRSRAKSELFLGFKGDPKEPAVIVQGQAVPVAKLHAEKLQYERYVSDWAATEGTALARSVYYRFKAPWTSYLFGPNQKPEGLFGTLKDSFIKRSIRAVFYKDDPIGFYTRYGKTPDKWSKIVKKYLKKKITPDWLKMFLEIREEGFADFITRTIREEYRSIVDLDFFYKLRRALTLEKLFVEKTLAPIEGQVVKSMSRLMAVVAEGTTTDYDSLAILLGKELKSTWNPIYPIFGSSLEDYHEQGSKILELFRQQGLIRVNSRGVTRRATVDLDTGRASGNWKDTVSREVQILDPKMLKLQDYNRRIELSNRLGVDRPENKYYVVPGKKTYVDARGRDTGIPVVTRSAFAKFDEKQIDGDFADMLNHTMSFRYEVDDEFSSFMDDLARFKDARGNAAYYDSINAFREEIIRRGDQGYGLMEAIRYYRATGKPFTVHARIDGRGRVYYNGYLTPTGGEVVRPFLNTAHATNMTPEGLKQLRIQMAAVIGPGTEALTDAGRLEIFKRNEKSILEIGALLSSKTQRDRRIREFMEHPFIQSTDGAEVAKIARFSLEYYRIYQHTKGNPDDLRLLRTYKSKLLGEADASASGLQMIALATGDRGAAITSNVLQSTKKNRIYDLVAQDTVADPRFQALMDDLGLNLTWEDLGKAAKYQVMIAFYGAGKGGQTARVALELAKVLRGKDILVTTRSEYLALTKQIDLKIKEAKALGATDTQADLLALKKELLEITNNPDKSVSAALLAEAAEIHPDLSDFVYKYSNRRGPQVGPDHFKQIAAIMSEKLTERAPVTGTYIDFWKRVGQDYARATKKVRIPWVTFDGKKLYQDYRPKIQQEIRFYDPQSKRYVRNIYQMSAEDGKLLGKGQVGDVRLGLGVNGTHADDASVVRRLHLWGRRVGVPTSTIHDAAALNINDIDPLLKEVRNIYRDFSKYPKVKKTLDALREEGLPDELYYKYLREAEQLGYFEPGFKPDEITAPLKNGYDYYGWGP